MSRSGERHTDKIFTDHVNRAPGRGDTLRIAPAFERIAFVRLTGSHHFRPHVRDTYEVILTDAGRYVCRLDGREIALRAGEGVVVKPGDVHEDLCEPGLRYSAMGFHLGTRLDRAEEVQLFAPGVTPEMQVFKADPRAFRPLIKRLKAEADAPDAFSAHLQDALLLQFFWLLMRALPREAISERFLDLSLEQSFPVQFARTVRAHLSEPLSVADIARLMGVSESTLAHKCSKLLGVSAARAAAGIRLDRAMELLKNTSLLVKEVAARVGFEDQYAFSRAFKRRFGVSPVAAQKPVVKS